MTATNPNGDTTLVNLRINDELLKQIDQTAELEGMNRSELIRRATNDFIQRAKAAREEVTGWQSSPTDRPYDPEAYYLTASDKRGHSIRIRVSFPTEVGAMFKQILRADPMFNDDEAALVRNATIHFLHAHGERLKLGGVTRGADLLRKINEANVFKAQRERVEEYLLGVIERADTVAEEQGPTEAIELIRQEMGDLGSVVPPGTESKVADILQQKINEFTNRRLRLAT